jgi:hypothetical protein
VMVSRVWRQRTDSVPATSASGPMNEELRARIRQETEE